MTVRWYVAIAGALVAVAALVFLVGVPMSARDSGGTSVNCGTATRPDEQAAAYYQLHQEQLAVEATLDPVTGKVTGPGQQTTGGYVPVTPPDCAGAVGRRRMWTIPLGLAGLVIVGGASIVRRPGEIDHDRGRVGPKHGRESENPHY
jgi:hypothetical protein